MPMGGRYTGLVLMLILVVVSGYCVQCGLTMNMAIVMVVTLFLIVF